MLTNVTGLALNHHQRGATLIVSLVMLLVVLMLSTSLSTMALMDEKAARNERDKNIAIEAAESALADAEEDIENSTAATSRSAIFSAYSAQGFTEGCSKGEDNIYQGLCINPAPGQKATWLTADIANTGGDSPSVQFGRFTGNTMPSGKGPFPIQLPRYIIELVRDTTASQSASGVYTPRHSKSRLETDGFFRLARREEAAQWFLRNDEQRGQAEKDAVYNRDFEWRGVYMYRITAIGFGTDSSTQILLQSFYRKAEIEHLELSTTKLKVGRLSWREISNWQDLKNQ